MSKVFISYSHKDEGWKNRLVTQLGVLEQEGLLEIWEDRRIGGGDDWLKQIEEALNSADVAILMITAEFLTSAFILTEEVLLLLERRLNEGVRVIPLIVKPCTWNKVEWLKVIQARPKDGKPLSRMKKPDADQALADLAEEICELLGRAGSVVEQTRTKKPKLRKNKPLVEPKVNTKSSIDTVTETEGTGWNIKRIYWIVGIVAGLLGIVSIYCTLLWYLGYFGPKPTAVLDCGNWRMPSYIEKQRTDPCTLTADLDPNLAERLKPQSMYYILVHNDSGHTIKKARARIPDADYVEVARNYAKPKEAQPFRKLIDKSWKLGNMEQGDTVEVIAWTKKKLGKELTKGIWINHESKGPSVAPQIKTPPNFLGEWTNQYTIWVVAIVIVIIGGPLVIYKYKLCRRFCGLITPKTGATT